MLNRNLEIFIKVVEYGSITKSAKTLYITQPAVSNALSKLATDLNVKLFFRDKRNGLLLTDVGHKILTLAKQMQDIDNRIYQAAYKENNLIEGRLRIAALTSLTSTIVSKALKKYRTLYPDVTIEIKEGTPNDIFRMVEDHTVDFAVSCSPFGKFDSITLIHDHIVAMLPEDNNAISSIDLNMPPNTLIINKPAYETIIEHIPYNKIVNADKILLVQNAETAINMVADAIGIGIISEYTLDTLARGFSKYPISPTISFDIGVFANDLDDLTPVAFEFVRIIKENS
ncbi:LysR family transcriptional regulator [Psychrobacillus sp. NPDC093180]|uniref:LysR family transcriptional regulator n=1 Tax=Psychrobacillus sp. NPDC093180 TaxID=3364489 RepID=UPI00381D9CA0